MLSFTTTAINKAVSTELPTFLAESGVFEVTITSLQYTVSVTGSTGINVAGTAAKDGVEKGSFRKYIGLTNKDGSARFGAETRVKEIISTIAGGGVNVSIKMDTPIEKSFDGKVTGNSYDFIGEKDGRKGKFGGRKVGAKIQLRWGERNYPEVEDVNFIPIDSDDWKKALELEPTMTIHGTPPVQKPAFDVLSSFKTASVPTAQPVQQATQKTGGTVEVADEYDDDVPF